MTLVSSTTTPGGGAKQEFDTSIRLATIRQGELLRSATRQRRIRSARLANRRARRHTTTEGA